MILFRYLARQILSTTLALTVVLTAVVVTGRFIRYLSDVASGQLSGDILFQLMLYRIPGFLDVVLPLSLFIAILLVYGRLFADSEMTVIHACGISQARILLYTLWPALLMAAVLAWFSLVITPLGFARAELLVNDPQYSAGLATLMPGRFQGGDDRSTAHYVERMSDDQSQMERLFIASRERDDKGRVRQVITVADTGQVVSDEASGARYLELQKGVRYEGWPGQRDVSVTRFETYGQRLEAKEQKADSKRLTNSAALPTLDIWHSTWAWDKAALHWRLSLPLVMPISLLVALPLSRTSPRQGRWQKLVPAVLLFLFYLILLIAVRDAIASVRIESVSALWAVHGAFLLLGVVLMAWPSLRSRWQQRAQRMTA